MTKSQVETSLGCGLLIAFVLVFVFAPKGGGPENFLVGTAVAALKAVAYGFGLTLAVGFIMGLFRTDQDILANIEERKKEALDKDVFNLALRVLKEWGKPVEGKLHFENEKIDISATVPAGKNVKVVIVADDKIVFECTSIIKKGKFYDEPEIRIQPAGESFVIVKEYGTGDSVTMNIESYIPGRWVGILERLKQRADVERVAKHKAEEVRRAKDTAQAERHKFGL